MSEPLPVKPERPARDEKDHGLTCNACGQPLPGIIVRGDLWDFDVKCAIKAGMSQEAAWEFADKHALVRVRKLTAEQAAAEYQSALAKELGLA